MDIIPAFKRNRPAAVILIFMVVFVSGVSDVRARQVTYMVKGAVTDVTHWLENKFSIGDSFCLEYTIETGIPDFQYRDPDKGVYQDAVIQISVQVGDYSATGKGRVDIEITNNSDDGEDVYALQLRDPLNGESIFSGYEFRLDVLSPLLMLRDPTGNSFEDDSLMAYAPDLSAFSGDMGLNFESYPQGGEYEFVTASISSFTVTGSDPVCQSDFEGGDGDMDGADLAMLAKDLSMGIIQDFAYSFGGCVCMRSPFVHHGDHVVRDQTDIQRLKDITRITGYLSIYDTDLADLKGLESLTKIDGDLNIEDNPYLETLSGLDSLSSAGNLQIKDNPSLISVAMDSLCHVKDYLWIGNNESLCNARAYELKDQILNCPSDEADGTMVIGSNKICSE